MERLNHPLNIKQEPHSPSGSEPETQLPQYRMDSLVLQASDVRDVKANLVQCASVKTEGEQLGVSTTVNTSTCKKLKGKILQGRRARGLRDINIQFETPVEHKMTQQELEKRERRKDQNRKAAARHRQKKRMRQRVEEEEIDSIMKENNYLSSVDIPTLTEEVKVLEQILNKHMSSGKCKLVDCASCVSQTDVMRHAFPQHQQQPTHNQLLVNSLACQNGQTYQASASGQPVTSTAGSDLSNEAQLFSQLPQNILELINEIEAQPVQSTAAQLHSVATQSHPSPAQPMADEGDMQQEAVSSLSSLGFTFDSSSLTSIPDQTILDSRELPADLNSIEIDPFPSYAEDSSSGPQCSPVTPLSTAVRNLTKSFDACNENGQINLCSVSSEEQAQIQSQVSRPPPPYPYTEDNTPLYPLVSPNMVQPVNLFHANSSRGYGDSVYNCSSNNDDRGITVLGQLSDEVQSYCNNNNNNNNNQSYNDKNNNSNNYNSSSSNYNYNGFSNNYSYNNYNNSNQRVPSAQGSTPTPCRTCSPQQISAHAISPIPGCQHHNLSLPSPSQFPPTPSPGQLAPTPSPGQSSATPSPHFLHSQASSRTQFAFPPCSSSGADLDSLMSMDIRPDMSL